MAVEGDLFYVIKYMAKFAQCQVPVDQRRRILDARFRVGSEHQDVTFSRDHSGKIAFQAAFFRGYVSFWGSSATSLG